MVADATTGLTWDIQWSTIQAWQREQITLEVTVQATDPFALLKTDKLVIPNMEVVPLPPLDETNTTNNSHHNQHNHDTKLTPLSLRWQLYPHTAGQHAIQLPVMRYYLNGGTREKWQPPLQYIDVKALPPYLPPTIPIGKVSINSHIVPSGILQPDSLAYWHISLHSTTVTTAQFPPLLKQLQATQHLDVLPAKVSVNTNKATGVFRLDYRIPIKAKTSGKLNLPALQWHWFNPQTSRLEKMHYEPTRPWVLAIWQRIILILTSGLLLFTGAYQLIKKGLHHYYRWWSRYQVLQQCRHHADNDALLQHSMLQCSQRHGWAENVSIRQWLHQWQQCYGEDPLLQQALLAYEKRRFDVH